jgi:hypothetical protein
MIGELTDLEVVFIKVVLRYDQNPLRFEYRYLHHPVSTADGDER